MVSRARNGIGNKGGKGRSLVAAGRGGRSASSVVKAKRSGKHNPSHPRNSRNPDYRNYGYPEAVYAGSGVHGADYYYDDFDEGDRKNLALVQGASYRNAMPICDFAIEMLATRPTLWQRVVLKLFAGEELSTEAVDPYDISEAEWLELAHQRGRVPEDVYYRLKKRGNLGFENLNLICGRRSGKTAVIAMVVLYRAYLLLLMPNPQAHYGMQESETILIAVAANSEDQSTDAPFGRIKSLLQEAVARGGGIAEYLDDDGIKTQNIYFKTLHDREVSEKSDSRARNVRQASVRIRAYHTNQRTVRGGAVIVTLFDEFGWFPVTDTEDKGATFYGTLTKGQAQFKGDAASFALSSPAFQFGKFYEMYTEAWAGGSPKTLAMQLPSWEAWEFEPEPLVTLKQLADDDKEVGFRWDEGSGQSLEEALAEASPEFKREWGAQFEGAESQWLEPAVVDRFYDATVPFRARGERRRAYYMHFDAGTHRDAFAVAICHRDGGRVVFDYDYRFFVAPNREYVPRDRETVYFKEGAEPAFIDSGDVEEHLKGLLERFNIVRCTYDQRDSHFLSGTLSRYSMNRGIRTQFKKVEQTYDYNVHNASEFRQMILEGKVVAAPSEIGRGELLRLQKNRRGVVEKTRGSTDDLFDSYRTAAAQALQGYEYAEGMTRGDHGGPSLTPAIARGGM